MNIYTVGDLHGERLRFTHTGYAIEGNLKKDDILIVCGDFGFVFFGNEKERKFLDQLEKRDYLILFVDGNHENFDELYRYPVENWRGGKVHRIRRNVLHLMRGQIFDFPELGINVFTMGGAYSIDKMFRQEGKSWWPEEMPSEEEYDEARRNLERVNYKVDYIITHTLPEDSMSIFHPYHPEEQKLSFFLEWVREKTTYKHWYAGHLHRDEDIWRHQTLLYYDVRNLITNIPVGKVEREDPYWREDER